MRFNFARVAMAAIVLVVASGASAEEIDRHFEKTFEVQEGARLVLEHGDGDVVLRAASGSSIEVDIRYRADVKSGGAGTKADFEVEFDQTGDIVRITGREPRFRGLGFSGVQVHEYIYEIAAPAWVELELDGADGDVEISGMRASVEIELSDGDIDLRDIAAPRVRLRLSDGDTEIEGLDAELEIKTSDGDMELADCRISGGSLRTSDGDITLRDCSGSFEVRTADGDFRADRLAAGRVQVESSDGDITLELVESSDLDLEIRTADGTVEIDHAPGVSASFEIETRDGGIRIDTPMVVDMNKGRRRATGKLGDGSGRISITTGDGQIILRGTS